jgi:hypothetical protein
MAEVHGLLIQCHAEHENKMKRTLLWSRPGVLAIVCIFLCTVDPCDSAAQSSIYDQPATVSVRVRLKTTYDDSHDNLSVLSAVARYGPKRTVIVTLGDNLDKIFVREYGFGKSDLPKTYTLLLPVILSENHLRKAEDLRPGVMIIPAIPRRTLMHWGRDNPRNYIANEFEYSIDSAVFAGSAANRHPVQSSTSPLESALGDLDYKTPTTVGPYRSTVPIAVLSLEMGAKEAVTLVDSGTFPHGAASISTYPLPVKLASDDRCDTERSSRDHPTLTITQRNEISQLLAKGSRRSPVLFILDTGWPSQEAYHESITTLNAVLGAIWKEKLGKPFTQLKEGNVMTAAHNGHCRCIARSLKELTALDIDADPSERIRVVYVPLTREQDADPVLTGLLMTSMLLQRLGATRASIDTGVVDGSRKEARRLIAKVLPRQWAGDEVQTDKSLLDAILLVGQAYARISDTLFFVNESWTVRHPDFGGQYYVEYQSPQFGLVTAATGNDGSATLLDFAQRAPNTNDTMAVLNITSAGIDSTSTRMPERNIDVSLAVGFDGYVTDDIFGTSFSAPRVAWFLAAGEAVRAPPTAIDERVIEISRAIRELRDPTAIEYNKLRFDPVEYLQTLSAKAISGP